jgi:hypothetical protein
VFRTGVSPSVSLKHDEGSYRSGRPGCPELLKQEPDEAVTTVITVDEWD